uniref:HMG box domain-containing protein n=1 Tax=Xiphophorus couchianus TaxID=32473 RepID=A0A3B5MNC6_9TELE
MAPYNLLTATASLMASIVCGANINPVKYLTWQASGPPKRPLNGYMRYVLQQKPVVISQNPEIKLVDAVRKIAEQWRMMSPEQKQPFQQASVQAMNQFKVDLQKYQAQLSPAQLQQQALEKRQRMAKRKAIRKKREKSGITSQDKCGKTKQLFSDFNSTSNVSVMVPSFHPSSFVIFHIKMSWQTEGKAWEHFRFVNILQSEDQQHLTRNTFQFSQLNLDSK